MLTLSPFHLADLQRSGLSGDTITLAEFQTVPVRQIKKILGFDFPGIDSAYAIPYLGCDGFFRLRCFPAEGANIAKYYQKAGTSNHLYIPPGTLDNPEATLYITEGEKKALKASQEGIPCVAIGGLWNWKDKDGRLIPDFDKLSLNGRDIHIIPDNDYLLPDRHGDEKNLRQAVQGLAEALIAKGALVSIIELPDGSAKGVDDYLITHSVDELLALPTRQVRTLSIEEAVAEVTPDTLDAVIKRVAGLSSASKQELLVAELSRRLEISKTALKKDLKHHGAKLETDQTGKAGLPMIALFPALVDLVEDDGKVAFLIKEGSDLRVETVVELDGVQHVPPDRTDLPYLLPRAEQCLSHYKDDDYGLFNDLQSYLKRFSFLPDGQWLIAGLFILSTYLQDHPAIGYSPMILFHAAPERGKSRSGKAVCYVAYRGAHLVDMRETNIFRYSGNLAATIFFDIQDLKKAIERAGSQDIMLLRYEKGATVPRVLNPDRGAFKDTTHYSVFGPTIMATNAPVHVILGSRCITYTMPNAPGNYENPTKALGQDTKERLVAWRAKHMGTPLRDLEPIDGITGRLWDITKPLFQICLVACPERYDSLVAAILDIAGARIQDKKDSFDGLLVQVIFELTQGYAEHFDISTADVTARFNELWNGDKPKDERWTGRRLNFLGVKTNTKTGYSRFTIDRTTLDTFLAQYGFMREGGKTDSRNSRNSSNSKDVDITDYSCFELPNSTNSLTQETQKNSKADIPINSSCFELHELSDDISGVFAKVAEKENLREVRI